MDDFFRGEFARRYAVFHATSPQAATDPTPRATYGYVHVADVDALSTDDAIALTTYRGYPWQGQAFAWAASGVQRSTSVGDLIYLYESEKLWVVQPSGCARSPLSPEQLALEWRSL